MVSSLHHVPNLLVYSAYIEYKIVTCSSLHLHVPGSCGAVYPIPVLSTVRNTFSFYCKLIFWILGITKISMLSRQRVRTYVLDNLCIFLIRLLYRKKRNSSSWSVDYLSFLRQVAIGYLNNLACSGSLLSSWSGRRESDRGLNLYYNCCVPRL